MKKTITFLMAMLCVTMVYAQYGILVNGKTYFAAEYKGPDGAGEGFEEYLAHVSVKSGEYCQLYDVNNKAAWAVNVNTYSEQGFTRDGDKIKISVTGCYDFYIKLKYEADELYIGSGKDCGAGMDISGQGGDQGPCPAERACQGRPAACPAAGGACGAAQGGEEG